MSSKQQRWRSIADVFNRGEVVLPSPAFRPPSLNPSSEWLEELSRQHYTDIYLVECKECGYLTNPLFVECATCLSERQKRIAENNENACLEVVSG